MLTVGDQFPSFDLPAVVGWEEPKFARVTSEDLAGQWLVVFFWPMDFTSVCPTEIAAFNRLAPEFAALDAALVGVSVDSEYTHRAWRRQHPHLRHLHVPMVSDTGRVLVDALGIADRDRRVALRATFIVDPDRRIRHVSVHDLATGRSVDEVLRTLAALKTAGPTPCGWRPGKPLASDAPAEASEPATDPTPPLPEMPGSRPS
jgi:alkyl hydroperoxide reductase subunit AhpC